MNIKNLSEFAKLHGVSQQTMHARIKSGWIFGMLDGKQVMYSPKSVMQVIDGEINSGSIIDPSKIIGSHELKKY